MSPKMVTLRPAIFPFFSRMVKTSSSAWVGCSCAPSPALTTQAFRKRERKWGAPVALWRMMMMSALRASRLRAVSLRVSPFLSEDASAEKLMTSALSRCAASSKLMRVRVEGSMKRLMTVLPRRAGTFLMARSPTALKARGGSGAGGISPGGGGFFCGGFAGGLEGAGGVEDGADFPGGEGFDVQEVFAVPAHLRSR